jgi:hypothetical protein
MTAAVPALLAEAAAWVGAIVVVVSGLTLIFTRKPFKWVARKVVSEPFGGWVQRRVEDGTKDIRHLTEYHLGPNSGAPPLHTRIAVLEVRALVDSWADDVEEDEQ